MSQIIDRLIETPSQTAGPYVHIGCIPSFAGLDRIYPEDLGKSPATKNAKGKTILISGRVLDGTGAPILDAMLESWQSDSQGLYPGQAGADPNVNGFCRFAADKDSGEFTLQTIKPGFVKDRSGAMLAPHINIWIVARGINIGLSTRIYFSDEDNSDDPLLLRIEQRHRRDTLIADKVGDDKFRFDIYLQGNKETVFLDM